MKHKMILLALAAVSAAMFALPAAASAGTWELDNAVGQTFTVASVGGTALTTAGDTINCTGSTGTGHYNTTTTGVITLTFTGCTDAATSSGCKSGSTEGTIVTNANLPFTNVYLQPGPHKPGTTIKGTGTNEEFAHFSCFFGLVPVTVTGTILGEMENAATKCNTETKELATVFESTSAGNQKWKQVTTTGSTEDLTSTIGESTETASQDGTGITRFPNNVKPTCVA